MNNLETTALFLFVAIVGPAVLMILVVVWTMFFAMIGSFFG